MAAPAKPSSAAVAVCIGFGVLAALIYALTLATLSSLANSDAAGNAYAQAYGAIEIIILWLLLAIMTLIAALKGDMPWPAIVAAVVLIPASGVAALSAGDLLARPDVSPFLYPLIIPALVPPLVATSCFWALLPRLRAMVPARAAAGSIWGAVLIASLAIFPLMEQRDLANKNFAAARATYAEDFAKLPLDAPLWDWVPFLQTRDETRVNATLARIRALPRRQDDAEIMLDRGDFPLGFLERFDLTPTQAICDKARNQLRREVQPLALTTPNSKPYAQIAAQVADALAAMKWLVGYGCNSDDEALAWETVANAYKDPNFDVIELRELRDPKRLEQYLRENPERFAMLTPQAHLKAWLKFADNKALRDQALAGARKLDHRTADAIEMLGADEHAAWTVLLYLPQLDLEATPSLCGAAQTALHKQFTKIYRPKAGDPRTYSELLERLGAGDPFGDLIWLASHGCDAETELAEVEELIRAYQDSPARTAMLTRLAQLRRRP